MQPVAVASVCDVIDIELVRVHAGVSKIGQAGVKILNQVINGFPFPDTTSSIHPALGFNFNDGQTPYLVGSQGGFRPRWQSTPWAIQSSPG